MRSRSAGGPDPVAADAAVAHVHTAEEGARNMKVGRVEIVPLLDGTARVPIEEAVAHPEGKRWDCAEHPIGETGRIRMDIGSFMVKIGDRTILVDVGGGVFSEDGTT